MSLALDYDVYYIDLHVLIQRLCYLCLEKLAAVSPVSYPAFKITGVTQSPLQYYMNFQTHIFFISAIKVSWLVLTVTLTQLTVTREEAVSNERLPRLDWPVTMSVVGGCLDD